MTERLREGGSRPASHWPERSMDRGIADPAKRIPPHPDHGDLPPCDAGVGKKSEAKRCPRDAVWHYGYGYYCGEHMEWVRAGEDYDDLSDALYWARRFLWKAEVEGIEHLEHYLGQAVSKIDEDRMRTNGRIREAARKAGMEPEAAEQGPGTRGEA